MNATSMNSRTSTQTKAAGARSPKRRAFNPDPPLAAEAVTDVSNETPVNGAIPHTAFERMTAAMDDYLDTLVLPSWTRQITAVLFGIMSYGTTWYLGMLGLNALFLALSMSAVGFIAFMASLFGVIVVALASLTIGEHVYRAVLNFDTKRVTNLFKRKSDAPIKWWFVGKE